MILILARGGPRCRRHLVFIRPFRVSRFHRWRRRRRRQCLPQWRRIWCRVCSPGRTVYKLRKSELPKIARHYRGALHNCCHRRMRPVAIAMLGKLKGDSWKWLELLEVGGWRRRAAAPERYPAYIRKKSTGIDILWINSRRLKREP